MTQEHDDLLPPAADAALDNLLEQWAASRALTISQAAMIYRAIPIRNQELSGQWYLDLFQHINRPLSRVLRPSSSLFVFQHLATADRSLVGLREGRRSPKRMAAYRPYLQLAPGFLNSVG